MNLYSTILPITGLDEKTFIEEVINWNQRSQNPISDIHYEGEQSIILGSPDNYLRIETCKEANMAAVRYSNYDKGFEWITECVADFRTNLIRISLTRNLTENARHVNHAYSVPGLVRRFIEDGYIADDAGLQVLQKPIIANEYNMKIIGSIMSGQTKTILPVVYFPRTYANEVLLSPDECSRLSHKLTGAAHVIILEDQCLTGYLRQCADGANTFNGTVGIYFENPTLNKRLINQDNPYDITEVVLGNIEKYHESQDVRGLTWENVIDSNAKFRQYQYRRKSEELTGQMSTIMQESEQHLKELQNTNMEKQEVQKKLAEVSTLNQTMQTEIKECNDLLNSVSSDLDRKDAKITELQNEICMLNARLDGMQFKYGNRESAVLISGQEADLFEGETRGIVYDVLEQAYKATPDINCRRHDVLGSLLTANPCENTPNKHLREIKQALKKGSQESTLKSLGLYQAREVGHPIYVYYGDSRYTCTASKSASDYRDSDNMSSDIFKVML